MDLSLNIPLANSSFKRQYWARAVDYRTPSPPPQSPGAPESQSDHGNDAKRRKLDSSTIRPAYGGGAQHVQHNGAPLVAPPGNDATQSLLPKSTHPSLSPLDVFATVATAPGLSDAVPNNPTYGRSTVGTRSNPHVGDYYQTHSNPPHYNAEFAQATSGPSTGHPLSTYTRSPSINRYHYGSGHQQNGHSFEQMGSSTAREDLSMNPSIQEAELLMNFVYASNQATPRMRDEYSPLEARRPSYNSTAAFPSHSPPQGLFKLPKSTSQAHNNFRRSSSMSEHRATTQSPRKPPSTISVDAPPLETTQMSSPDHVSKRKLKSDLVPQEVATSTPDWGSNHQVTVMQEGVVGMAESSHRSASLVMEGAQPDTAPATQSEPISDVAKSGDAPPEASAVQNGTSKADEAGLIADVMPKSGRSAETCASCHLVRRTDNGFHDLWISCNGCKQWLHHNCAGFESERKVRDVDKFYCKACEPKHGTTTFVRKSARAHASVDYAGLNEGKIRTAVDITEHHYIQPIKEGKIQFQQETFPRMRPELVTAQYFERCSGFSEPIVIPAWMNPRPAMPGAADISADYNEIEVEALDEETRAQHGLLDQNFEYDCVEDDGQDRLDMVIPQGLTVRQVAELYGPEEKVEVIDVKSQEGEDKRWNMRQWADYYEATGDKPVRNVISLEVSQSRLGRLIKRPKVVRDLDLQDAVWPADEMARGLFPKVQFYCLMSVADCYTDFHIDFGGSSVYYHILRGKKTFFFIPPKKQHLKKYEDWCNSADQNSTFLGDLTKECYRVDLSEGDTMLIPSGWIHSVWTPENSLVIGGNFLTRMHYGMQIAVNEIEKNTNVARKFRYPYFQKILWHAVIQYLEEDPIPSTVVDALYQGEVFQRKTPVYFEFDGSVDDSDPELFNARYYSQGEIEGLQDLLRYIFRTVLVSLGKVQGVTQTTQQAVIRSMPKGYGEPLDLVKTFAMWAAWKRGNEVIPQWALPDADISTLESIAGEKKMSAAALKKIERQAAHEAYLIAPERRSARQTIKESSANAESPVQQDEPSPNKLQAIPKPSGVSVRPACKPCRDRRIRCKHREEMVETVAPTTQMPRKEIVPRFGVRVVDNVIGTSTTSMNSVSSIADSNASTLAGVFIGMPSQSFNEAENEPPVVLKQETAPAIMSIEKTMMDTSELSSTAKKARSKACSECRKSKRRCLHDAVGQIDPLKAQESPVARGSRVAKKFVATLPTPLSNGDDVVVKQSPESLMTPDEQASAPLPADITNNLATEMDIDGDYEVQLYDTRSLEKLKGLPYDPASPPYEDIILGSARATTTTMSGTTNMSGSPYNGSKAPVEVNIAQSMEEAGPTIDCITPPVSDNGVPPIPTISHEGMGMQENTNAKLYESTLSAQDDSNGVDANAALTNLSTPSLCARSGSIDGAEIPKSPVPTSPLTDLATSPVGNGVGRAPIKYTNYANDSPPSPRMGPRRGAVPTTPSRTTGGRRSKARSVSKEVTTKAGSVGPPRSGINNIKAQTTIEEQEEDDEDMRFAKQLQEQEFGLRRRSR